jgi:transcriptional regulator with XRE-family HTH domain
LPIDTVSCKTQNCVERNAMPDNRIWDLRKERNLTQRELAQKVGTSQQQIQRVEAGVVTVRLELAAKIADALGVRLGELFPKLARSKRGSKRSKIAPPDADRELMEAGVDPDPKIWTAKFFMNDGRLFFFRLSSTEKDRLESAINESDELFLIFDSDEKRVALNRTKVGACQFLFDYNLSEKPESEEEEFRLKAHFISSQVPIVFDVEPDECVLEKDDEGFASQLQGLFTFIEGANARSSFSVLRTRFMEQVSRGIY